MAENEHIMTTRAKQRSRTGASNDTTPTVLPDAPESTTFTRRTTSTKSKTSIKKTNTATTSRSAGKKSVYNPDTESDAEENITIAIPGSEKQSAYNPDLGSDAEDNITVLPPAITTKPSASKGKAKQAQAGNPSGSINDDMLALSFQDPITPLTFQTNGKQRTAPTPKTTTKRATTARKPKSKPPTSDYEFSDPAPTTQAPESRVVHPEYLNLPPDVPVDEQGIPTTYYAKVDGKVKIWGKKRGD
ncbi:hypothetical protein KCU65_g9188, partial [Aureobasidium melanogenum]